MSKKTDAEIKMKAKGLGRSFVNGLGEDGAAVIVGALCQLYEKCERLDRQWFILMIGYLGLMASVAFAVFGKSG